MRRAALVCIICTLAGCAGNADRFLINTPAAATPIAVPVATIEVRDVSLPAYAAAIEISQEERGGALRNIRTSLWADEPVRGVTAALARSLDNATSATVAAEPWPLSEPADALLDVRVERMLARADGSFDFSGQYAISAPDGAVRERLQRFDIRIPAAQPGASGVAAASGAAIAALATEIARTLAR